MFEFQPYKIIINVQVDAMFFFFFFFFWGVLKNYVFKMWHSLDVRNNYRKRENIILIRLELKRNKQHIYSPKGYENNE